MQMLWKVNFLRMAKFLFTSKEVVTNYFSCKFGMVPSGNNCTRCNFRQTKSNSGSLLCTVLVTSIGPCNSYQIPFDRQLSFHASLTFRSFAID